MLNLGCTRHSSSELDSALICTRFQAEARWCVMNPRALPPVTHGSALQAPERLRGSCDLTTHPYRTDVSQALCCLEGSTMSNLVHRRRRCARIVLHSILCLEGSTPEDRSGADTQAAPVGRCMCGIPYPGCRFALPWAKCLLPFQGAYFAGR